jgi:hypothetical protein
LVLERELFPPDEKNAAVVFYGNVMAGYRYLWVDSLEAFRGDKQSNQAFQVDGLSVLFPKFFHAMRECVFI